MRILEIRFPCWVGQGPVRQRDGNRSSAGEAAKRRKHESKEVVNHSNFISSKAPDIYLLLNSKNSNVSFGKPSN